MILNPRSFSAAAMVASALSGRSSEILLPARSSDIFSPVASRASASRLNDSSIDASMRSYICARSSDALT